MKRCFVEQGWWKLEDDGTLIISMKGEIVPPVFGKKWNEKYDDKVKSVIIKKGATSLGYWLFDNFINLETVIVEDGVERILSYAFCDWWDSDNLNNLRVVKLPGSVTEIRPGAFKDCHHVDVYIDNYEENVCISSMDNDCHFIFKQKEFGSVIKTVIFRFSDWIAAKKLKKQISKDNQK